MLSTRYRIPPSEGASFLESAQIALSVLTAQPGALSGRVGRATDDPQLWLLTCEWESVGAYRRALSVYEVRMHAIPVMSRALDEPTAFEVLRAVDPTAVSSGPTRRAADADQVGVGRASGPEVRSDLG